MRSTVQDAVSMHPPFHRVDPGCKSEGDSHALCPPMAELQGNCLWGSLHPSPESLCVSARTLFTLLRLSHFSTLRNLGLVILCLGERPSLGPVRCLLPYLMTLPQRVLGSLAGFFFSLSSRIEIKNSSARNRKLVVEKQHRST